MSYLELLNKLPDYELKKLQRIQNSDARIITQQRKFTHITPILIDLHWLPVTCRIQYKILLLAFKCIIGKAPAYLASILQPYVPPRALRSAALHRLQEPSAQRKYRERAFSVCAPKLWNSLPLSPTMQDNRNF